MADKHGSQDKHGGHLGAVYGAGSPADISRLYDDWSQTYDAEMARNGYRHPSVILALLARHVPIGDGPILDAGAGTGLLGDILSLVGYPRLEALDVSPGMLALAARRGCYKACHAMTLGGPLAFATGYFAAVASAGVFTVGHVGAEALDELVRITRPGGVLVFTVKEALWTDGFAEHVAGLERAGRVTRVEDVAPYISMPGDTATTPSRALVLRVKA